MKAWSHEVGDVLLITHKGQEVIARVTGYVDSLDNTTPLLCNLRIADGQAWGRRVVKVQASEIIKPLPDWQTERDAWFEQSIKETAERIYARMTPEQKQRLAAQSDRRRGRTPWEIMLDNVEWLPIDEEE